MQWYFRKKEFSNNIYVYEYSHENKEFDGILEYDLKKEEIKIKKPCKNNVTPRSLRRTEEHFYDVIENDFPEYKSVITG